MKTFQTSIAVSLLSFLALGTVGCGPESEGPSPRPEGAEKAAYGEAPADEPEIIKTPKPASPSPKKTDAETPDGKVKSGDGATADKVEPKGDTNAGETAAEPPPDTGFKPWMNIFMKNSIRMSTMATGVTEEPAAEPEPFDIDLYEVTAQDFADWCAAKNETDGPGSCNSGGWAGGYEYKGQHIENAPYCNVLREKDETYDETLKVKVKVRADRGDYPEMVLSRKTCSSSTWQLCQNNSECPSPNDTCEYYATWSLGGGWPSDENEIDVRQLEPKQSMMYLNSDRSSQVGFRCCHPETP